MQQSVLPPEGHNDNSLAPRTWDSYIGQEKVKERLRISIDGAMSRFEPLKHVLLLGAAGTGKGHPHGTPILTPNGWTKIEELKVGDEVIGSNGLPTKLTGVFDRGILDTYTVKFSDGSSVDCDPDHIWWARTQKGQFKEYTVTELLSSNLRRNVTSTKKKPSFRYRIPLVEAVQFPERDLPVDPYLLGALLANGNLTQGIITTNDIEVIKRCEENAPAWLTFTEYSPNPARRWKLNDYDSGHKVNRLLNTLREMGLYGKKSREKFVPEEYLYASVGQRLALLHALMDCDGSQRGNHTSFSSYSENLAYSVQILVQSLGGTASVVERWREEDGTNEYTVNINLKEYSPFSSSKKQSKWNEASGKKGVYNPFRKIVEIKPAGKSEVICLRVEAEDCLYVTKDFIVTHNTSLAEIIAKETDTDLLALTMTPNFQMPKLYHRIQNFEGGTMFLDEIHCLNKKSQHYLLDVLEKKKMTWDNGKVEYIDVPITFIAATTESDLLIKPLFDRFPIRHMLEDYSDLEMAKIVERMAIQVGLQPTKEGCLALGRASAGVPRQARTLVFAAQDFGSMDYIDEILNTCGVTPEGLTEDHIAYMKSLYELGGKAGKANIALHSGRPEKIVIGLEKLLVSRGYIEVGTGGRQLLYSGMQVLKEALS